MYGSILYSFSSFFFLWTVSILLFFFFSSWDVVYTCGKESSFCERSTWKWQHQVRQERLLLVGCSKNGSTLGNFQTGGWERNVFLLKDLIGGYISYLCRRFSAQISATWQWHIFWTALKNLIAWVHLAKMLLNKGAIIIRFLIEAKSKKKQVWATAYYFLWKPSKWNKIHLS